MTMAGNKLNENKGRCGYYDIKMKLYQVFDSKTVFNCCYFCGRCAKNVDYVPVEMLSFNIAFLPVGKFC